MRQFGVLVFFVCSVGWACPRYMTWTELSDWLQRNVRDEHMHPLDVSLTCLIPKSGTPPKNFGQLLFQALWFETQMQHIATFFKRPVTAQALQRYDKLRVLCESRFSNSCGKPLQHRLKLYQKQVVEDQGISAGF